ncbi:MAG: 50S ribosomal protein L27 [Pseudomonadota bacterium]|nr:50S ribosomal protein L27 [Pseudomonadota bacterium]
MATKKAGGASKNGRDSQGQRRGVKVYGGSHVNVGDIIVRQVGCTFHAGSGVGCGKDFTLYARTDGIVTFSRYGKRRTRVSVA